MKVGKGIEPKDSYKPTHEQAQKWEQAYQEYHKQLYNYAYRITRNPQDAEDLLQQTFVKLAGHLNKLGDIHSHESFNYVYTILQRNIVDLFRKRSRSLEEAVNFDKMDLPTPAELDEVENFVIAKLKFEDVLDFLRNMDEKYKQPFVMRYLDNRSIEEIADVTNQSKATVSMQIFRAKQKIKHYIDEREWD